MVIGIVLLLSGFISIYEFVRMRNTVSNLINDNISAINTSRLMLEVSLRMLDSKVERACELVELLGAGEVVDGIIDVYPGKTDARTVKFDPARINTFLGTDIEPAFMETTLSSLGFGLNGSVVTVPSWRADVEDMADLAEEVIRIKGYNTVESTAICARTTEGCRTAEQNFELKLEATLIGMGVSEIETFSFISPKYYDKFGLAADDSRRKSIVISNPLGEDTSIMRTTALPSMMEILARNNNFNNENARLYEMAKVYIPDAEEGKLPYEPSSLTVGIYGNCDFYTIKGIVEALAGVARIKTSYVAESNEPSFHPGRCAKLVAGDKELAVLITTFCSSTLYSVS